MYKGANYKRFIEERLKIVDKTSTIIPFMLNPIQSQYILNDGSGHDVILKARQQGFSSMSLGIFATDFILKPNSVSVVVADIADNAVNLLDRVKFFLASYEEITGVKIPMKYNSKSELVNELMGSHFNVGTAENTEFGRSRTITNLLLSEAAFYPKMRKLLAGALQAVVPDGRAVIETTANGFNEFKDFWFETKQGLTGFKPLFYKASAFYDEAFLAKKRQELGRSFKQEYPETDIEAFLTSGAQYFDSDALQKYLERIEMGQITIKEDVVETKQTTPKHMEFYNNPNFNPNAPVIGYNDFEESDVPTVSGF